MRDLREHDSRTRLAETCGAERDESPRLESGSREAGGSNPSRCHETERRRENGLTSTTCERHAEKVRACFTQVFGKAGTNLCSP